MSFNGLSRLCLPSSSPSVDCVEKAFFVKAGKVVQMFDQLIWGVLSPGPRLPVLRGSCELRSGRLQQQVAKPCHPSPPPFPSLSYPLGSLPRCLQGPVRFGVGWFRAFFPPQHLRDASRPRIKAGVCSQRAETHPSKRKGLN